MKTGPMEHTGDSANLAIYAERGRPAGYIHADVCRNDFMPGALGVGMIRRQVPTFSFTVRKHGFGEVARFTYEPKTRPASGALPARTVTRLIRDRVRSS